MECVTSTAPAVPVPPAVPLLGVACLAAPLQQGESLFFFFINLTGG